MKTQEVNWLNENLRQKIREVFESKYHQPLSTEDIEAIASNLADFMGIVLKFKWRQKNANLHTYPSSTQAN